MSTFMEIILVGCFICLVWNLVSFVASKGEKSIKAGIACIILLITLFILDVETFLREILETLNKILSIMKAG